MNTTPTSAPIDATTPAQIAARLAVASATKTTRGLAQTLVLAMLAGGFIALGALFCTLVTSDSMLGAGPTRLLGGVSFSVGLVLVVVAGGELFTGNSLMILPVLDREVSSAAMLKNWLAVYVGNLAGALLIALMVVLSGVLDSPALSRTAADMAEAKLVLTPSEAFFRGILCNILVCLAVWMSLAAATIGGKALVVLLPIAAFVAVGFEHSVANMYVVPVAMMDGLIAPDIDGFLLNLVFVTLGNVIGGGGFVGAAYWCALRLAPVN